MDHEPFWANVAGIEPQYEELAEALHKVEGVERVAAIFTYEKRGFLPPDVTSEVVITLSAAAGALGMKALDIATELARDYIREKRARRPPQQITLYDQHGKKMKIVNLDPLE